VFAVVVEFLVDQHAFGTAASLNRTSHSVHNETLPVLYETLILDDPDRIKMEGQPPVGLQYTKYVTIFRITASCFYPLIRELLSWQIRLLHDTRGR
jgi:hypothetical protein